MVYFCVPTIKILEKKTIKKSNNYWILHKILFGSFDSKRIKCSYYSFLLNKWKRMHKMMQLISKTLHKKNMFPFMQSWGFSLFLVPQAWMDPLFFNFLNQEKIAKSLIPGLSFGHNLCFKCPNESCEPILNIYISIAF
jgi:hypothetical protein